MPKMLNRLLCVVDSFCFIYFSRSGTISKCLTYCTNRAQNLNHKMALTLFLFILHPPFQRCVSDCKCGS